MKLSTNTPPNFADSFKEYKDQVEADLAWPIAGTENRVDVLRDVLGWDGQADSTNTQTVHDLTSVSDSQWTLRFKITFDAFSNIAPSAGLISIGISNGNQTVARNAVQDYVGIEFSISSTVGILTRLHGADNQIIDAASSVADLNFDAALGQTRWIELRRISSVLISVSIYTDPDYTQLEEVVSGIIPTSLQSLQFIKVMRPPNFTTTNVLDGTIQDVQFWDNASPLTPVDNLPNYEDKFVIDKGWVTTDVARLNVNTITNKIDCVSAPLTAYDDVLYFDLGNNNPVSETFWTLRFKLTNTVFNATAVNAFQLLLGLSNNIENSATGQDYIGMRIVASNTFNAINFTFVNNANPRSQSVPVGDVLTTGGVFYIEIRRLTNTTAILNIYADAGYSQLIATSGVQTINAGITILRYLKVMNFALAGSNVAFDATVEDVKLFTDKGATKIQDWRENNG